MKFLQERAKAASVSELIHRRLSQPKLERSRKIVHVSDLTNQNREFCPREVVLTNEFNLPPGQANVPSVMQMTWDEGRDKQWRVNNDYLREYMVGYWICNHCGQHSAWGKYPGEKFVIACTSTHTKHDWEYKEPYFTHSYGFEGSLDGLVDLGLPKLRILEVKIIKSDDFKKLLAPLAEHRIRTRLYLQLVAESTNLPMADKVDTEVAHILYVMRGYGAKNEAGEITPLKEYLITRNDTEVEGYVKRAEVVNRCLLDGAYPSRICGSVHENRANACPVAVQCFSNKFPVSDGYG